MHDTDTFEFFKYIFKMAVSVYLVSHAFEFSMAVFDVAQNLVNGAAGVINTSAVVTADEIVAMVDTLKDLGLGEFIVIPLKLHSSNLQFKPFHWLLLLLYMGVCLKFTPIAPCRRFHLPLWATKNGVKSEITILKGYSLLGCKAYSYWFA